MKISKKYFYPILIGVFTANSLLSQNPIEVKKDSLTTLSTIGIVSPKVVTEEFKKFDYNNDSIISVEEHNIVIERTLDQEEGYNSKVTYRLIQYMQGLPLDNIAVLKDDHPLKETTAVPPATVQATENTSNKTFLEKHVQVGGSLIGLYMYGSGFKNALYDGPASIPSKEGGEALSLFTVPVDMQFWKGSEFNFTMQYSGGNGVGNGAGMAAYPNALFGFPQGNPYVLKAQYRQNFVLDTTLTKKIQKVNFTVGQIVVQEMIDCNPYACDPAVDFLNFSHNMLSGWDASTTAYGYSYGVASSIVFKRSSLNFAAITVNREGGGPVTDWNVKDGHSFNLQYAQQYNLFNKVGTIRFLGFTNRAKAGDYRYYDVDTLGVASFSDSLRSYRTKVGFGVDADMALTENIGLFARYSWNDDMTESFGYTEANQSINAGLLVSMGFFYRQNDKLGICSSYGTLSGNHQKFLKNGGSGFMLGDGALNYAPEIANEIFYSFSVFENLSLTANYQYVLNAGYNKDRGNTSFYSFRFNLSF